MKDVIESISKKCSSHFNVSIEGLYGCSRKGEKIIARHMLWYVLHYHYNVSISNISKSFSRSKRSIFSGIKKIKDGIKIQKFYKTIYNDFLNSLNV